VDVYQCPECELRFRNASEMEAHLRADHPNFRVERSDLDEYLAHAHQRRHGREKRYRPREDG
jgi:hypothetical protein